MGANSRVRGQEGENKDWRKLWENMYMWYATLERIAKNSDDHTHQKEDTLRFDMAQHAIYISLKYMEHGSTQLCET
jgi:hypothetical protein